MNENKTENVKESLEPVDIDKAGSEASEEGTHGLSKMFALLVYRSVHIRTRGFVSAYYKCTEFLDPGTMRISPDRMKKLETLRRNLMTLTTSLMMPEQLN